MGGCTSATSAHHFVGQPKATPEIVEVEPTPASASTAPAKVIFAVGDHVVVEGSPGVIDNGPHHDGEYHVVFTDGLDMFCTADDMHTDPSYAAPAEETCPATPATEIAPDATTLAPPAPAVSPLPPEIPAAQECSTHSAEGSNAVSAVALPEKAAPFSSLAPSTEAPTTSASPPVVPTQVADRQEALAPLGNEASPSIGAAIPKERSPEPAMKLPDSNSSVCQSADAGAGSVERAVVAPVDASLVDRVPAPQGGHNYLPCSSIPESSPLAPQDGELELVRPKLPVDLRANDMKLVVDFLREGIEDTGWDMYSDRHSSYSGKSTPRTTASLHSKRSSRYKSPHSRLVIPPVHDMLMSEKIDFSDCSPGLSVSASQSVLDENCRLKDELAQMRRQNLQLNAALQESPRRFQESPRR